MPEITANETDDLLIGYYNLQSLDLLQEILLGKQKAILIKPEHLEPYQTAEDEDA